MRGLDVLIKKYSESPIIRSCLSIPFYARLEFSLELFSYVYKELQLVRNSSGTQVEMDSTEESSSPYYRNLPPPPPPQTKNEMSEAWRFISSAVV